MQPPPLAEIPAGPFRMGDGDEARIIELPAFRIGIFPVTNAEYAEFVQSQAGRPPDRWPQGWTQEALACHPVVGVTWEEATAYCQWLLQVTGERFRLPTEEEWEKAARGTDGRAWPWGNSFAAALCNTWEGGWGRTTPVDTFPAGASPYGVMDLAGNVWEWCAAADGDPVLRGGSWYDTDWGVRCSRRLVADPDRADANTGFRVASDGDGYT